MGSLSHKADWAGAELSEKASITAEAPLPLLGNGPKLYKACKESSSRTIKHKGTTSG